MKIVDIRVMGGPNYWSIQRHQLIVMRLDLEELEKYPTHLIPGFYDRLVAKVPSLSSHLCTEGVAGGFLNKVKQGTWMGHVVEHLALEIQSLAGMDTCFGRTEEIGREGLYHVVFSYEYACAGKYAATAAVKIAEALVNNAAYDIDKDIHELKLLADEDFLGPSTYAIVSEAERRNIPHIRLDNHSLVQLGFGAAQKRIQATVASSTSGIAIELASDKELTKELLAKADIPVPVGSTVWDEEELKEAVKALGFPLAIKPLNGNHGKGVTTNISNETDALAAFATAQYYSRSVICEKFVEGKDYRALVINYRFVAAAMRTAAMVTGDGVHAIQELIERENANPKRGRGHQNLLTKISADNATLALLEKRNYTLQTVLDKGVECHLKPTANLSTGGTATDVTDIVHPANIALFERIARIIGLDICGIDVIAQTLEKPLKETGGSVLEVNAAPGFRMHLQPTNGRPRNVAANVIDMLFPNGNEGTIPIIAVTGTNGKTTTTRLIAHLAKRAGYNTGFTTTDGVYIQNDLVVKGDCSGPASAHIVLKDPSVEFAVLETARGGILRAGLGYPFCHAAVITNVAEDHLGLNGIDTIEKLARVKAVVAETVLPRGYTILNADDDLVYAMKDRVKSKVALFSMYENNLRIKRHCQDGGLAAILSNNYIVILQGDKRIKIDKVLNIPITFGGLAEFNILNLLGAVLAAFVSNINLDDIREGLQTFIPSPDLTPGRMNFFPFSNFTLIVDYAHNPHGMNAVGKFVRAFKATVKKGIIAGVGDRRNTDLMDIGEEAAKVFDEIVIRLDKDLRGRTADDIFNLVAAGIKRFDAQKQFTFNTSECAAIGEAIEKAVPGSLIVVLTDEVSEVIRFVQQKQLEEKRSRDGEKIIPAF